MGDLDTALSYVRKLKLLIRCLAVPRCPIHQWPWKKYLCSKVPPENDFGGSIIMIYKLERALVLAKKMFNYYNTKFLIEITSKVEKVVKQHTITQKLTTKCNFLMPSLILFCSTIMEWNAQEGYIYVAFKNRPDEGISGGRKWSWHWIRTSLEMHPSKLFSAIFQSIFQLSDGANVTSLDSEDMPCLPTSFCCLQS